MNERLVWIDCEMTGLDLRNDALIEIAALVTDSELNILDEGVDVVIKPPQESLEQMSQVVRDMHTTSGPLDALPGGVTLAEAEDILHKYVKEHAKEPNTAPVGGNSIATDPASRTPDTPPP